jgi:type I restriction enzyme M protein
MGVKISDLFQVMSGDFHAVKESELGKIPLVSCGDTDNGVMGYYDIPESKRYKRALTVAYNGSWPIMSKFHPYEFGAKDDVAVLIPKLPMQGLSLLYVAALLNRMTWRYSYGRKCFKDKLEGVDLPALTVITAGQHSINEVALRKLFPRGTAGIAETIAGEAANFMQLVAGAD